jgi:LysM repeat protein
VVVTPSTEVVLHNGQRFFKHIVSQGETLFSISRAYAVTVEDIIAVNPESANGLAIEQQLLIPIPVATKYTIHTVERGQTLFSISRMHQVDINELLDANPEIDQREFNLSIGQEIKIPAIIVVNNIPTIIYDTIPRTPKNPDEIDIALLLPLFISENFPVEPPSSAMTMDTRGVFRGRDGQYWSNPRSLPALEFYQGALIALDTLRKQGLKLNVSVFDTMRDTERVTQILQNPQLNNKDLIIGPFTTDLIDHAADFMRQRQVHYVSPTAINAESVQNNPYLIQVNTGEINTVNHIVDFISKKENIHITLINNRADADQTLFNVYRNRLNATFPASSITIREMQLPGLPQPREYLRNDVMNVVIVPTADETFVNFLTGQLNVASGNFRINLYGLANWTKFLNLDLQYLYALEFRYATAFYVDYDDVEVQNFLKKYRNMYSTEPTMLLDINRISQLQYLFAFLGYDIVYYFVSAIRELGRDLENLNNFDINTLQSDFRFQRFDAESGYRNTNFKIYRYTRNYSIIRE